MQLSSSVYEVLNTPPEFEHSDEATEYFSLTAPSNTKLSRKSLEEDELTAPMLLHRKRQPFTLAEVTVSVDFQADWDQGGLVIFLGGHPVQSQQSSRSLRRPYVVVDPRLNRTSHKWARVALEMTGGELHISTLVANPKCGVDWASTPAFPHIQGIHAADVSMPSLRLKLERVGADLWVWYMVPETQFQAGYVPTPEFVSRQWRKCREVVNFFDEQSMKDDVWVGCYASRPVEAEPEIDEGLFVEFEDLEIL
ncbi:hypothetical protein PMZ80_002508 [Knufia obscura]|uniref:Uncharacterized protein n=2 Tax=Knufia TaxID=430999 RepID=A0AAN8EG78_9EURO|nr:hypothetical protein PMZ80_002508 [Knufia obscura]KAK5950783.1 hypothetical protein OHC33_008166 [Knufia fluminis]